MNQAIENTKHEKYLFYLLLFDTEVHAKISKTKVHEKKLRLFNMPMSIPPKYFLNNMLRYPNPFLILLQIEKMEWKYVMGLEMLLLFYITSIIISQKSNNLYVLGYLNRGPTTL